MLVGYQYVTNPKFLRHIQITLISKWKATPNSGDCNASFSARIKTWPNINVKMAVSPKRRYLAAILQVFQ